MIAALLLGLMLVFLAIGFPVAMAITLATIVAMLAGGYDLRSIPQIMAAGTQSIPLMAVPFFILAANLMNALGVTQKIFDFATAAVGFMRGGLAQVNVLASMIFAGISGAAVADAAGLGTVEMRAMKAAGYRADFAAAVTLASSTIGPIIPPSIMMVIYAITARVSIADMFVAGLLPGLLIGAVLMVFIYYRVASGRQPCPPPVPFSLRQVGRTAVDGVLSLLAPAIILWGMVGGVVTPTEAGVLAIGYSMLLGFVYRRVSLSSLVPVLRESVQSTALILYIIAVSKVMSWVLINEGVARDLTSWFGAITDDPIVFLLVINVFLLLVGCLLETLPALLITVPVLLPSATALGVDPVHFGVIVIFNLLIGIITPPMGIGLFILTAISEVTYGALVRAVAPFLVALIIALLLISFVPPLTLYLPKLLLG